MTEIVERKLLDQLCTLRNSLIETNIQSVKLHKQAAKTAREINYLVPTSNRGYIDDFTVVMIDISNNLGEKSTSRIRVKESTLEFKPDDDIESAIVKSVDGGLWRLIFNRLGFYKSMSKNQKSSFDAQCKANPQPFTLDNVNTTLQSLYENRDADLLEALYDTFGALSSTYVSNNKRMFGKKVIIKDSFCEYGLNFKLSTHGQLETLFTVVWRWILVNQWHFDKNGVTENSIWSELKSQIEDIGQDYHQINSVELKCGIALNFWKNKNVHVLFPESMVDLLNDQLAKNQYLSAV
ncbi:DUF4942 domain-containing protein [Vibrio sp. 10N.239.312.D08]|uniref:DUF4942 domain-containing protein n=1 Tax=Vibrio sp. 10N.239.312.D08 TaxID=3229978 RepID=UPI00354F5C88